MYSSLLHKRTMSALVRLTTERQKDRSQPSDDESIEGDVPSSHVHCNLHCSQEPIVCRMLIRTSTEQPSYAIDSGLSMHKDLPLRGCIAIVLLNVARRMR